MEPLRNFPLPLPPTEPPIGYRWEERDISVLSTTTAFNTGIDARDKFLGRQRCVICGTANSHLLEHAHIIPIAESGTWSDLQSRGWIPSEAKDHPRHEPRNGILMCLNHHGMFDAYDFFIRYFPDIQKFVIVNYSDDPLLQTYHGKAIALDISDHHAPFPSLFIIHKMRVRGFHPFAILNPAIPNNVAWQDWILSDGVFNHVTGSFIRQRPRNRNTNVTVQPQLPPATANTGGPSSGGRTLAFDSNTFGDILAATRAMQSWKACQIEGTPWTGTAEENMHEYISSIGIQQC